MRRLLPGCVLVLGLLLPPRPACAQGFTYVTQGYSSFVQSANHYSLSSTALVEGIALEHYPNIGLDGAINRQREQLIGWMAEKYLEKTYPELLVDEDPRHKYSDVYRKCVSGSHCIDGKLAFQSKVHQDGKGSSYFKDFADNPEYKNAKAFIIPKEHRKAAREYAIEQGRPDIAEKLWAVKVEQHEERHRGEHEEKGELEERFHIF